MDSTDITIDEEGEDYSDEPEAGFFRRHRAFFMLAGLMIFAILMSVFVFAGQSLRLDESQSLWQTSRTPLKIFNIIAQDVHVPLYHLMLHFWQLYLGNSVYGARMLSLIFFVLSIPSMYMLGTLAYGKKEALFASLLLSISPFMNWYGNEIRMYSLFTFLIILNQYFFIRIFRNKEGEPRTAIWWGYFATCLFGIFTHYFFFLSLISQFIYYVINRRNFRDGSFKRFAIVAAVLAVAFSPWVLYVLTLNKLSNSSPLLDKPTSQSVFDTFSQFLFGFQVDAVNTVLVSLWPLTVLFGFLALRKRAISRETIYFLSALVIPMLLAFVISEYVRPLYLSRYLIFTMPSLYLLLAWLASLYPRRIEQGFKAVLVISMLVTLGIQAVSGATPVKENYRGASYYLMQHATASDIIVVSAPFTIYPVDYYYNGPATVTTLPIWNMMDYGPIPPFDENVLPEQAKSLMDGHDNLWLLLSYDQGYQEKLRLYFDMHFQRIDDENFSPGLDLYEYKIRY